MKLPMQTASIFLKFCANMQFVIIFKDGLCFFNSLSWIGIWWWLHLCMQLKEKKPTIFLIQFIKHDEIYITDPSCI